MVKVNGKEMTKEEFKLYLIKVRTLKNAKAAKKSKGDKK